MDNQQQDSNQHHDQNGMNVENVVANTAGCDKNSEEKKIFVGGISYDVTNEDLSSYFSQFGEVSQAQVKYDRNTGRSRGFAFVEFMTSDACKSALNLREQMLKNKVIEVKPAKSRENKKVFVGGLPADYAEDELRMHFEQFGKVEDIEWPCDKQTKARRNFAFIVFEEEDAADRAASTPKQTFGSRECDVKKAVPQGKRFVSGRGGGMMRGYVPGRGNVANGWFSHTAWGQMGGMGPYGTAATNAASWGDWYGNAATGYFPGGTGSSGYGGYGSGYDSYAQPNASQRGSQQRFPSQQQHQF